ncbi:Uncharacterised protein [Mycobacteroides abscessus subsp. abscessus]|uniref:hypothetical protein n=1 Tax=Mycobacteroides abscessus TaxID=36809 RepID=UPI00092CBD84|nr:hypothetical protein [Mycobacteroides abscessus]SHT26491.1 Uncharacterised protein [Mycobacteroides abscessus subsp. abscessus]SLE11544.1 Uncharacterised protein [Mycobacteroides abscessus subsp. bolletii]
MSFRVTYPVGSTFAAPNPQDGAEPFEDYNNEDAFAILPGGVLGIWDQAAQRSYFLPRGKWVLLTTDEGHPPGAQRVGAKWERVEALHQPPAI